MCMPRTASSNSLMGDYSVLDPAPRTLQRFHRSLWGPVKGLTDDQAQSNSNLQTNLRNCLIMLADIYDHCNRLHNILPLPGGSVVLCTSKHHKECLCMLETMLGVKTQHIEKKHVHRMHLNTRDLL